MGQNKVKVILNLKGKIFGCHNFIQVAFWQFLSALTAIRSYYETVVCDSFMSLGDLTSQDYLLNFAAQCFTLNYWTMFPAPAFV